MRNILLDLVKDNYYHVLSERQNILARGQNPLAALAVIVSILSIAVSLHNNSVPQISFLQWVVGLYYTLLVVAFILILSAVEKLIRLFAPREYKFIRDPQEVHKLALELEASGIKRKQCKEEFVMQMIGEYMETAQHNVTQNDQRDEYLRVATERIVYAMVLVIFGHVLLLFINLCMGRGVSQT